MIYANPCTNCLTSRPIYLISPFKYYDINSHWAYIKAILCYIKSNESMTFQFERKQSSHWMSFTCTYWFTLGSCTHWFTRIDLPLAVERIELPLAIIHTGLPLAVIQIDLPLAVIHIELPLAKSSSSCWLLATSGLELNCTVFLV